jgi:hypothetical protein
MPQREVLVEAPQLLREHPLLLARPVVEVLPQPFLDAAQELPGALGSGEANHRHVAVPVGAQVVLEPEQVEMVGVALASLPVSSAEGDQLRLVFRQREAEFRHALGKRVREFLGAPGARRRRCNRPQSGRVALALGSVDARRA